MKLLCRYIGMATLVVYLTGMSSVDAMSVSYLGSNVALGPTAAQQRGQSHRKAYEAQRRGAIKSYAQIKNEVQRKMRAKVVGQNLFKTNSGWRYQLVMRHRKGRVSHVIVDAKTGKILAKRAAKR